MDQYFKELEIIVKIVMIMLYRNLWIMIVRKIIISSSKSSRNNKGSNNSKYRSIMLK